MNSQEIETALAGIPIGPWRYFERIGSTNDLAAEWAVQGTPDLSLVIADEQTSGRGRSSRKWLTPPGAALAFSIISRPVSHLDLTHYSALGALAVCEAIEKLFHLECEIKWPNDVLLSGRKIAGVLVETKWSGETVTAVILGIGLNVTPASIPEKTFLSFPATCLESEVGRPADRWGLLAEILACLLLRLSSLGTQEFLDTWWSRLAWKGQQVSLVSEAGLELIKGRLTGLEPDGGLKLENLEGQVHIIHAGDLHLRV